MTTRKRVLLWAVVLAGLSVVAVGLVLWAVPRRIRIERSTVDAILAATKVSQVEALLGQPPTYRTTDTAEWRVYVPTPGSEDQYLRVAVRFDGLGQLYEVGCGSAGRPSLLSRIMYRLRL